MNYTLNTLRLLLALSVLSISLHMSAQVAIGPKVYTRLTDDRVGPTAGVGLHLNYVMRDPASPTSLFSAGFDISFPQHFAAKATLDAHDSSTVPFTFTVPVNQKVSDYVLHLGGGFFTNRNKNTWVITFGLRGMFRIVKTQYLQSFDESTYDRSTASYSPRIPAAINLGLVAGIGYWYRHDWLVLYPTMSFGFGSNDWRGKHPWNKYPNYLELSLTVMITGRD